MPFGCAVIDDIHSVDHEEPANAKARQPRGHQKKGNSHLLMPFGYAVIADIHSVDHEKPANAKARQPRGHQKKGNSHLLMPFGYAVIADIHSVDHEKPANAKARQPRGSKQTAPDCSIEGWTPIPSILNPFDQTSLLFSSEPPRFAG